MSLPEQLLLSDLLRRRVRCDQGLDHGPGTEAWMHPPVHRLLGWISRPSSFGDRRLAWRLDQLRGLAEQELFVQGAGADTDQPTVDRLPTLIGASLLGRDREVIGRVVDAAVEFSSGRIVHYLVARSDPRLPGSSRWRLSPERIVDQQPGQVFTAIEGLDDLPLARASVRQEFLRRSRRWRDQVQEETSRLRDQFQQAGDRFEERLEGWMEEPPWDAPPEYDVDAPWLERPERPRSGRDRPEPYPRSGDTWDDWPDENPPAPRRRRSEPAAGQDEREDDPWF